MKMRQQLKEIVSFFSTDIWQIKEDGLSQIKKISLNVFRVCYLTVKFFMKNNCRLRASALTLLTLLSIVPVVALIFGIAKGYGYDDVLKSKFLESMQGQEKIAEWIIQFAESALLNASGGVIAGVGVCFLLWTAIKLFGNVEKSFNSIWGIQRGRTFLRRFTDYFTQLMIFPLLMIVIAACNALITTQLSWLAFCLPYGHFFHSFFPKLFPLQIAWLTFSFLYAFIPNTRVKISQAVLSGLFTGMVYLVVQQVYLILQTSLTSYNAIYGSFAALPFFLIWLQASWTIILLGAQLCFSIENFRKYNPGEDNLIFSEYYESLVAVRIMSHLCSTFIKMEHPCTRDDLENDLSIPDFTLHTVLSKMIKVGLIHQILPVEQHSDYLYQIAYPAEKITPVFVIRKLNECGGNGFHFDNYSKIEGIVNEVWNRMEKEMQNHDIMNLDGK